MTTTAILAVHRASVPFVTGIIENARTALEKHYGAVQYMPCENIEDIDTKPGDRVFIIGDAFKPFKKAAGAKYIFLNFSVLYPVGNIFAFGLSGWRLARHKRKVFQKKLPSLDYVLNYYPTQTDLIAREPIVRKMGIGVGTFPVDVTPPANAGKKMADRQFDVCFVGSKSPRRDKLLAMMTDAGLSISLQSGVVLEEVAADSRVVLNVHAHRSNHLELPRIVGALHSGAVLVTEPCYGMAEVFPGNTYIEREYSKMVASIMGVLRDLRRFNWTPDTAATWMRDVYTPACEEQWPAALTEMDAALS